MENTPPTMDRVPALLVAHPGHEPHYEGVGRPRLARGSYEQLITYVQHVRPLAISLSTG